MMWKIAIERDENVLINDFNDDNFDFVKNFSCMIMECRCVCEISQRKFPFFYDEIMLVAPT